jgi:hypothetical protein
MEFVPAVTTGIETTECVRVSMRKGVWSVIATSGDSEPRNRALTREALPRETVSVTVIDAVATMRTSVEETNSTAIGQEPSEMVAGGGGETTPT